MTARNQPHPLRCETCAYFKLYEPERSEFADCLHPDFENDPFIREIQGYEYDRIEVMGCASHSDAGKAEQRIAEDLLELIKDMGDDENCGPLWKMNSDKCYTFHSCALCKATKALALLREKGE